MLKLCAIPLMCCAAMVAQAADLEDVADRLDDALERQAELLSDVEDAESAAELLPKLREVAAELLALKSEAPERELLTYVDNSTDCKNSIIISLQVTARQFMRLEAEDFYGNAGLKELYGPQIPPPPSVEPAPEASPDAKPVKK